ncbi:MAG TPA: TIGR03118 family protein [Bryobacteraceae bacterium]|nr:TIGR03118 family protein [Bryobacteraceae bacterium]
MLRSKSLTLGAVLAVAVAPAAFSASANAYIQTNLVADTAGVALLTDPNLVNPWGIAISTTSPFWLSDNGTGLATVYSTSASATLTVSTLKVTIPVGAASTEKLGPVTGQISNTTTAFLLANGTKASFIFCTEDGTVSAWNGGTAAAIQVDNSSKGAVYKGLTLGGTSTAPQIYVANFNAGTVEVYDGNFAPVKLASGAFTDSQIPAGFAPFNVQNLNGKLYVTYAKQDAAKYDDVPGPGNGYVDIYDMNGASLQRLVAGGALNSPWGVAIAPANFGTFSNDLLVGNFGNGIINVYDPVAGTSLGALQNTSGTTIAISGLWGLQVGNGKSGGDSNAVYFTAGPSGTHGLFGSLQAGPVASTSNPVVDGADFAPGIAQYSWISVFGSNLSSTTRGWLASDMPGGKLPTALDNVSVTVDGKPAYVAYISPTQINALVPADLTLGAVQVSTSNQGLASASVSAQMQATTPAFFISKSNYIAALHANNTVVGPTTLYPNNSTPAAPGETIMLFGTGFGPASTPIPDGQMITTAIPVTGVTITVGGAPAQVTFAGLVMPGLYQFNVVIPSATANGDAQVVATVGNSISPTGALVNVHN